MRSGFSHEFVGKVGAVAGTNGAANSAKDAERIAIFAREFGKGIG
jgi:hypothetical protein